MADALTVHSSDKVVEAVAKIIALTQDGQLAWRPIPPESIPLDGQDYERVEAAYQTLFHERTLRLYTRSYKVEKSVPNPFNQFAYPFTGSKTKVERINRITLEYIDQFGNSLWAFPGVEGLSNLLSAVRYHTAGKDLLDEILAA